MDNKYKVLESRQIQTLSPTGASQEAYRVWIQTAKGSSGHVDVAPDNWTADKLRPILETFADRLDLAFAVTQ